jgi:hypothetical protein
MTMPEPEEVCAQCGATDWEARRPTLWKALVDWLGSGRWPSPSRVCRRCGLVSMGDEVAYLTLHRPSLWTVPVRALDVLRRRRSAQPVPLTYLMAAGVGVALGVVLQVLLGWAWWAVTLGVVAVVWLVFMSTAFWGTRATGPGHDLLTELLREISPDRAAARRDRREQELWASPPLPLYGLPPAWEGDCRTGGYGASNKAITSMKIVHGDLVGKGPYLRVEVTTEPDRSCLPRSLAEELWHRAMEPPGEMSPSQTTRWLMARRRDIESRPDPEWRTISIPVDGRAVAFSWLAEGRMWVAYANVEGFTVTLRARDMPIESIELERINDTRRYVEGSERLRQERRRLHGH